MKRKDSMKVHTVTETTHTMTLSLRDILNFVRKEAEMTYAVPPANASIMFVDAYGSDSLDDVDGVRIQWTAKA